MKDVTLVVLAAGMGSRYGGLKQIDPIGPNGEIILEMSAFDAIRAGFNKIVFIIKKAIEEDFKKAIGNKIADHIKVEYVFQEMDACLPEGYEIPADRVKPWGTAHAILCCKNVIHEPFAVINADDYYGIACLLYTSTQLLAIKDEIVKEAEQEHTFSGAPKNSESKVKYIYKTEELQKEKKTDRCV